MKVSIDEAGGRLAELVEAAEAGNEVILTRDGKSTVKLIPSDDAPEELKTASQKRALIASPGAR